MASYVYPALFHPNQDDGSYTILFPDLPGCISEGKDLDNALSMAQDALAQWVIYQSEEGTELPAASAPQAVATEGDEFVSLVRAEVKEGKAVKRTVSLPQWMDAQASEAGLSLSRVLQDALRERLSA